MAVSGSETETESDTQSGSESGAYALAGRVAAAAELLGVSPGAASRSRRHGYRPCARRHVERYLLRVVYGVRAEDMARAEGYTARAIYDSIRLGSLIARANAARLGLTPGDVLGTPGGL